MFFPHHGKGAGVESYRNYSRTYFPDEEKEPGVDLKADPPGTEKGEFKKILIYH